MSSKLAPEGGSARGRRRGRKKKKETEDAELPRTPWLPQGTPCTLPDEMLAFQKLMQLTDEELKKRDAFIEAVRTVAASLPHSTVRLSGNHTYGIGLPNAPVSVSVEDLGPDAEVSVEMFKETFDEVKELPPSPMRCVEGSPQPLLVLAGSVGGVKGEVALFGGTDAVEREVQATVKEWVAEYPSAVVVTILAHHVLAQACPQLLEEWEGGIPPLALLAKAVSSCKSCITQDPAEVFLAFLEQNRQADFTNFSITTTKGTVVPLVQECKRLLQLRAHVQSCHIALNQFDAKRDTHTALSTIVSHQPLWKRVEGGAPEKKPSSSSSVLSSAVLSSGSSVSSSKSKPLDNIGGYRAGQWVETLRSDGTWSTCLIVGIDVVKERVTVQGPGYVKKVSLDKLGVTSTTAPEWGKHLVQQQEQPQQPPQTGPVVLVPTVTPSGIAYVPCVVAPNALVSPLSSGKDASMSTPSVQHLTSGTSALASAESVSGTGSGFISAADALSSFGTVAEGAGAAEESGSDLDIDVATLTKNLRALGDV